MNLKTKRDNEKETVYFLWTMSYQFLSQNNYIYEDYEWMLQHLDAICCSVVWTTCRKYPVQRNRISNCRHWYNLNINTPLLHAIHGSEMTFWFPFYHSWTMCSRKEKNNWNLSLRALLSLFILLTPSSVFHFIFYLLLNTYRRNFNTFVILVIHNSFVFWKKQPRKYSQEKKAFLHILVSFSMSNDSFCPKTFRREDISHSYIIRHRHTFYCFGRSFTSTFTSIPLHYNKKIYCNI